MNKFKRVYFRINTPSYYKNKYGVGFENQEAGNLFQKIATELFINDSWEIKKERYSNSGGCTTVIKDKQELYLHPQSFSGVVLEDNIKDIETLLSNNDLFKYERIDIYEDVFDLTDEEYIETLESKQDEIEKDILESFTTKRRNLFHTSTGSILNRVLDKHRIKRLSHYVGVYSSSDIDYKFICDVFKELSESKKMVASETRNGIGYRTINKTEQKELKIAI